MNYTNLRYKGKVNIKLKIKDKLIEVSHHNDGLMYLQFAFAKLMINDIITEDLHPQYIDLRQYDNGQWVSYLQNTIALTGKTIQYEQNPSTLQLEYYAVLTSVLSYSSLQNEIQSNDDHLYRLYLYSGDKSSPNDFAFIDIDVNTLSRLSPGVQAVIEWTMQLVNDTAESEGE